MSAAVSMPAIGQWYLELDTGRMFEVVSVDPRGAIEIQDYEGNLDEFELEDWLTLNLQEMDQPEDLLGIFDLAEPDEADGSDEYEREGEEQYRLVTPSDETAGLP